MGVDEAHYVLYGKKIALSYFDHPPLVGWVHALFQLLPINHLIKARLPALVISVLTTKLIVDFLRSKNTSENHIFVAVGILNLTPLFNAMSVALLPDTLLMPLTLLIIQRTEKILCHSSMKNWLWLGLWLGLAGLAKYTAALFVIALVLIFIIKNLYKELLKPALWCGVAVALLLIVPVLLWNINNNFSSFQYQTNHVLNLNSDMMKKLGSSLLIQIFSWGIGPFFIALAAHFVFLKKIKQNTGYAIATLFLTVFLIFFLYVALAEVLLPHWMLIYFILMLPVGYAYYLKHLPQSKIIILSYAVSALLSLIILLELSFKIFPIDYTKAIYEGVYGWEQTMTEANKKLSVVGNSKKALAVMNWTLGSRALYYNSAFNSEVFVIDSRHDQFDIWSPNTSLGYDLIVIIEAPKKEEHLAHLNCESLNPLGEIINSIKDVPVNHFLYYHCANFLGYR